jgi:hypothetical protein
MERKRRKSEENVDICTKDDEMRGAAPTIVHPSAHKAKPKREYFDDSVYAPNWLSKLESDLLFGEICQIGLQESRKRAAVQDWKKTKYPMWTMTYGLQRDLDGAYALDRWGSYHENWCKLQRAPKSLENICKRINRDFEDENGVVNSMVVNFYWDGETTFIPAHRDTVACLEDTSKVYCLSLGASRDFILCDNNDAGKYIKSEMNIAEEWRVNHGDLFALGQKSNVNYCHAVPQEPDVKDLRVSIIFRCIDKSFIDLNAPKREVTYASGNVKEFSAECVTTKNIKDVGTREHIVDLVSKRELAKLKKLIAKKEADLAAKKAGSDDDDKASGLVKQQDTEDPKQYFMGAGLTVPNSPTSPSSPTLANDSPTTRTPVKTQISSPALEMQSAKEKAEEAKRREIAELVERQVDIRCKQEAKRSSAMKKLNARPRSSESKVTEEMTADSKNTDSKAADSKSSRLRNRATTKQVVESKCVDYETPEYIHDNEDSRERSPSDPVPDSLQHISKGSNRLSDATERKMSSSSSPGPSVPSSPSILSRKFPIFKRRNSNNK